MRKTLITLSLLLLVACAAGRAWKGFPTDFARELAWPPPPEAPCVAWVAEIRNHQDLFTSAGAWRRIQEWVGGPADSTMVDPFALASHPRGGLLVADPGRRLVHFYDWNRRRYVAIGPRREGGLRSPVGVAVAPDGRVLVADSELGSVECFDADGKALAPFVEAGTLKRPAGLACDAERAEVYVADVLEHQVVVCDLQGVVKRKLGRRGDAAGQFNFPTHLALDGQGRLLVTDSMNFRVQLLEPDGRPVQTFGKLGDAPGQFARPKGVAADADGNIIAIESLHDAMQFFDGQGRLLLSIGTPGAGRGQFWLPAGLAIDRAAGLLFVADSYNRRVQVFRLLNRQDAKGAEKQ